MSLPKEKIQEIVTEFYQRATNDILIGFHFRNIADFDEHIPRIVQFWEIQLNGKSSENVSPPFDLIKSHIPLQIKLGQLNRWVKIFEDVLAEVREQEGHHIAEYLKWKERIDFFKQKFLTSPHLFSR